MMNERRPRPTRYLLCAGLLMLALSVFFVDGTRAEQLILPDATRRIEEEAFFGSTSLEEVVLNEALEYIGPRAFAGSSGLKLVTFPSEPVDIATDAFDGCGLLQALVTPGSWAQQWCEDNSIPWLTPPVYGQGPLIVKNGASLQIELDSPHAADARYSWTSDNEDVLTVDENGLIFGEYPGTATLTAALPGGGEPVEIPVQVQANYRAALFSESTYLEGTLMRNRGDVMIMSRLLASVTGPDGGRYSVSSFDDLVSSEVFQKITEVLEIPSREGDVSIFFFASHGDPTSTDPQTAGRLWCVKKQTWVALPDLAAALLRVKGKVIVILESCGPGAAMHDFSARSLPRLAYAGVGLSGAAAVAEAAEAEAEDEIPVEEIAAYQSEMIETVVTAFSAVDPGLDGGATGNLFLDSGEKFAIMAAAGYMEYSKAYREQYGNAAGSSNVFPYFIGQGVGTSGAMPADTNGDGILTLHELHTYVYTKVYNHTTRRNSNNVLIPGQKTVVWPTNSSYPLFLRYTPEAGE